MHRWLMFSAEYQKHYYDHANVWLKDLKPITGVYELHSWLRAGTSTLDGEIEN